jgi:hypothetical protein
MCYAKDDPKAPATGHRCDGACRGEERAAADHARKDGHAAAAMTAPLAPVAVLDAPADDRARDVESTRAWADVLDEAMRRPPEYEDVEEDPQYADLDEAEVCTVLRRMTRAHYDELEQDLRQLGAAVLGRAEELAGLTVAEAGERSARRLDDAVFAIQFHRDPAVRRAFAARTVDERNARLNQLTPEQLDEAGRVQGEYVMASLGADPEGRADLRRLADGYHGALAELREMGALVTLHPDSDPEAVAYVEEAAQRLPADWGNSGGRVYAQLDTRGGYTTDEIDGELVDAVYIGTEFRVPVPTLAGTRQLIELDEYAAGIHPAVAVAGHEFGGHGSEENIEGVKQLEESLLRRRTTNPDGARHELELLNPQSTKQAARSGVESAARGPFTPEQVAALHDVGAEVGYSDSFPLRYMGRVYDNGSREVLSMGIEAALYGAHGGLVGVGNYRPDVDVLHFTLGMLAVAGRGEPDYL